MGVTTQTGRGASRERESGRGLGVHMLLPRSPAWSEGSKGQQQLGVCVDPGLICSVASRCWVCKAGRL